MTRSAPDSDSRLIRAGHSAAFLSEGADLRRLPRAPQKPRPTTFLDRYEDRALVYDAFWHADGQRILLVGPPPMNLRPHYRTARYRAGGTDLQARYFPSLSTMITELSGAAPATREIAMELAGQSFVLPVRVNHAANFAGRRLLFTMSKDNDLAWITEWARWHHKMHGADAIVFFDNGSTRYETQAIEETLLGVDGIERVAVESWPWRYGMTDAALLANPFYILFLQVSSMSVVLRRFGSAAYGILNADIDELVATPAGTTIFELAKQAPNGLVVMRGHYMEPLADGTGPHTHRDYTRMFADPKRAASRQKKWAIDPSRQWFEDLRVQPYMHWIEHRPWFGKSTPDGVFYRHFRGINTNWKDNRTDASAIRGDELVIDAGFADLVAANAF